MKQLCNAAMRSESGVHTNGDTEEMLSHDYLALRVKRMKESGKWTRKEGTIVFILGMRGSAICISGMRTQRFGPRDLVVVNSARGIQLSVPIGDELVFSTFSVQVEHLFPLFANEEVWLVQELLNRFKDIRLYPSGSEVSTECYQIMEEAPPEYNLSHRSHLLRMAAAVFSAELASARPWNRGYVRLEDHFHRIFDSLSGDEILRLSVDELAVRFSCSRRHLNRLFHQRFGLSVSALRMELRLLKAASLLRDADAKVINVAEQCEFHHLGLFNTRFKRRFGMSPGEWRRRMEAQEPVKISGSR